MSWLDSFEHWATDLHTFRGWGGWGGLHGFDDAAHDFGTLFSANGGDLGNRLLGVAKGLGNSVGSAATLPLGVVHDVLDQAVGPVDRWVSAPFQRAGVSLLSLGEYDRFHREGQSPEQYRQMLLDNIFHPSSVGGGFGNLGELASSIRNSGGNLSVNDRIINMAGSLLTIPKMDASFVTRLISPGANLFNTISAGFVGSNPTSNVRINPWDPEARKAWFENADSPYAFDSTYGNLPYAIIVDPLNLADGAGAIIKGATVVPKLVRTGEIVNDAAKAEDVAHAAQATQHVPTVLGFRRPGFQTLDEYATRLDNSVVNKDDLYKTLNAFAENDSTWASKHYLVRKYVTDAQKGAASHLLGSASTPEEVADVFKVLTKSGSPEEVDAAIARLGAKHMTDGEYTYLLDRMNSGVRESNPAVWMDNAGLPGPVITDPVLIRQHDAMVDSLVKNVNGADNAASAAYRQALESMRMSPAPALTRGFAPSQTVLNGMLSKAGRLSGKVGSVAASKGTDVKFLENADGTVTPIERTVYDLPDVAIHMASESHPLIAIFTHSLGRAKDFFTEYRPTGLTNLNNGNEVMREAAAYIADADSVLGGTLAKTGEARQWLNRVIAAQSIGEKQSVFNAMMNRFENMRLDVFDQRMASKGLSPLTKDARDGILNELQQHTASVYSQMGRNGYVTVKDADGMPVIAMAPLLERQGADSMVLRNLRELDRALRENDVTSLNNRYSGLINRFDKGLQTLTNFNELFKTTALMRLGYTVRNLAEAHLSMFATGMYFASLGAVGGESARAVFSNISNGARHLVDNVATRTGARIDPHVLQARVAQTKAVLTGLLDFQDQLAGALSRSGVHMSDGDAAKFQELYQARQLGQPLSAEEQAWFDDKFETLQLASRLRAEHEGDILFHGSPDGISKIKTPIAMTHSEGLANQWADRAHEYFSIENFNEKNLATMGRSSRTTYIEPRPVQVVMEDGKQKLLARNPADGDLPGGRNELAPAGIPPTDKMSDRKKAMLQAMLDRALDGDKVQMTTGSAGWRTVGPDKLSSMLKDGFLDRANIERVVFRVRKADQVPTTRKIQVYGGYQSARTWAEVPQSLRDALGLKDYAGFREFMKTRMFDDPEVRQKLSQWGDENNVGKIEFADSKANGGHTVIAFPQFFSRSMTDAIPPAQVVARHVHDYMGELRDGFNPVVPDADTNPRWGRWSAMSTARAERRRFMMDRAQSSLNGVRNRPVRPDYDKAQLQEMMRNDLPTLLRSTAEQQKQAYHDLMVSIAAYEKRASEVSGLGAKAYTGQGAQTVHVPGVGKVVIPGIYQHDTAAGQIYHRLMSSAQSFESLSSYAKGLHAGPAAMVGTRVEPSDARYFEAWSNILNHHFRDSASGTIDPLVERLLGGESPESIANWVKSTGPGSDYMRHMSWDVSDVQNKVNDLQHAVKMYLPGSIAHDWAAGNVNEAYLMREFAGKPNELQPLFGRLVPTSLESAAESKTRRMASSWSSWFFKYLGQLPEDAFARHPLARGVYRKEMAGKVAAARAYLGRDLTLDEMNRLADEARMTAFETVRKTLFNVDRKTGAGQSRIVGLASPFYKAWENQLRRWGGFVYNNPMPLLVAKWGFDRALPSLPIYDQNGDKVTDPSKVDINSDIVIMPSWLTKGISNAFKATGVLKGVGDQLSQYGAKVPMKSFDVVSQGNPFRPDFGPLVGIPVQHFASQIPDSSRLLNFMFPAGLPSDSTSQLMASSIKDIYTVARNDVFHSPTQTYLNAQDSIFKHEMMQYELGKRTDKPTASEIRQKTDAYFMLKMVTHLTSPVSVSYSNDVSYLAEELRRFRKAYPNGNEGDLRFLDAHPYAFSVLTPLSQNTGHLWAQDGVTANLQRYSDLVAKTSEYGVPDLMGFIGNYGMTYDPNKFSQAAYQWQLQNSPVPGGSKYRSGANPMEQYRQAKVEAGWLRFTQVVDMAETQMQANGIDLNSNYAQKTLKNIKSQFAAYLGSKNKDWQEDYFNPDPTKYEKRAYFFEQVIDDKSTPFMKDHGNDPLMKSIGVFLQARNAILNQLSDRKAGGGSGVLDSQANNDLSGAYDSIVNDLKTRAIEFGPWYERYFGHDLVVSR